MLIKAGVDISRLRPCIRKKLTPIGGIVHAITGKEMVVSSTYEGNHSASSLHYCNEAIDIRNRQKKTQVWEEIKQYLGDDYDVILYKTHIHIEYDPK